MANVKVWKEGAPGEPSFSNNFNIVKKAVLQCTDIKTNRNKYYAIELHSAGKKYRVYTHYGRTDDLETNPNAGVRECRYLGSLPEAEATYASIYAKKTSSTKGYREVNLASSKIGSQKARGTSSGTVDSETLGRLNASKNGKAGKGAKVTKPKIGVSKLPAEVQTLVSYIYDEATHALTKTVQAQITAQGIETPLGILTLGQIEDGEKILHDIYNQLSKKGRGYKDRLVQLTGDFYTVIPHRIGRSRQAAEASVINSMADFKQKQDTLQLMKDMLSVNGDSKSVLLDPEIDQKYKALGCYITHLSKSSADYKQIHDYVSKVHRGGKLRNIYTLKRPKEHRAFDQKVGNERLLFHGSRIENWVGILSRGILLPKIVVKMGVHRTDAGWLGNGIYFGDVTQTSLQYASAGRRSTTLMAVARVALGKMKDFMKITYGLSSPPRGFDSCHGVRSKRGVNSQFADDEYVIYRTEQQRMEYLVEVG